MPALPDEREDNTSSSDRFQWCKGFAADLKLAEIYVLKLNTMKSLLLFVAICASLPGCSQNNAANNQPKNKIHVGGSCEGCEAIYESLTPFEQLNHLDTLPDFNDGGPKIEISGIVYHRDGKTPAKDVVIYVYHTDQTGVYPTKGNESGWGKRHGYIRGWVKTDKNGYYQFYTLRPAAYPNRPDPAHIHITIKEPDKNEYWIDEYLFADDPLLTEKNIHNNKGRGGNGIIKLLPQANGVAHGTRHLFLGLHVPDYPYAGLPKINSGLAIGANCPAFDPLHLSGADSGKTTCPMCKYGNGQGILLWFNHANLEHMASFVKNLESEMKNRSEKNFRVFLVYMNPFHNQNSRQGEEILGGKIRKWCNEEGLKKVSMLWVPSPTDSKTCRLYKINPEAKNTVFVYKKRKVVAKWVNIEYDDASLESILKKI